jgi:hypothetical protein
MRLIEDMSGTNIRSTHFAFDLYFDPLAQTYSVARQEAKLPPGMCRLVVQVGRDSSTVDEQTAPSSTSTAGQKDFFHDFRSSPPPGQWTRIAVDVDFGALPAASLKVTLRSPGDEGTDAGTVVVDDHLSAGCSGLATPSFLSVGFDCVVGSTPMTQLRFDNVLFTGR